MTPDGKVKEKIKDVLKKYAVYYFMPRGTAFGRAGVPDFVCCYMGFFVAIEAKAGKNEPTALQKKELQTIATSGGYSLVINESNVQDLADLLDSIMSVVSRVRLQEDGNAE